MGGKKRLGELEKLMYNEESDRSTSISGSPLKADSLRVSAFFFTTNVKTIPYHAKRHSLRKWERDLKTIK